MKTFYFNTGVQPYKHNPPVKLSPGHIMKGGTMQIPFDCDNVPDRAQFMFACDNPDLKESEYENVIVREIFNSALLSKYAYFKILSK
jgi:hypothetical protein